MKEELIIACPKGRLENKVVKYLYDRGLKIEDAFFDDEIRKLTFDTNFNGTYKIVKYCTENNIPLIYAGSSSHHSGKFSNPYTFSKDMGEEIIQLYQKHFKLKS